MKELEELQERMRQQRPVDWDQLPDLALYMDQLISYMPRQLIRFEDSDALTSAMVNNYIKDGLLPRADGKRYSREHLAHLTAICALKPVLSIKEMGALIRAVTTGRSTQTLYANFLDLLDQSLTAAAEELDPQAGQEELVGLAFRLALNSYANKLACQRVLGLLRQEQEPDSKRRNEGKK